MQSESVRIIQRNRRETEKILHNIAKYEAEIQEEMCREFDHSTFDLELQGFHSALYLTADNLSDCSNMETDQNFYLSNAITSSPYDQTKFNFISNRINTPTPIKPIMSRNIENT